MSSINSSLLSAQSTANPIRRTSDGLRGAAAQIGNPAAAKPQFRGSNAPTLDVTALATTTASGSSQNALVAPQNGAAPQRPLRPGSIINISSIASIRHLGISYVTYATTKAAMNQMTRTTAVEFAAQKVRVNAILPGLMKTPMVEHSAGLAASYAKGDVEAM